MKQSLVVTLVLSILVGATSILTMRPAAVRGHAEPKYYQDSMHPWVKSERPGTCPICAMELSPIYETGMPSSDASKSKKGKTVILSQGAITVANVKTEPIRRRPIARTLRVSGTIEPDETSTFVVAAPANARVESVQIRHVGDFVNQGDPVVRLFSPELAQRARFLRLASTNKLVGSAALRDSKPMDGSHTSMDPLSSPRDTAERTRQPGQASPDLFSTELVAPGSGIVTERPVYVGQYLMEGQKVISIVDPRLVWFRFELPIEQYEILEPGQEVLIRVGKSGAKTCRAIVSVIEPMVDEQSRLVRVRAAITNQPSERGPAKAFDLPLGGICEGSASITIPSTLAIPRSAVLNPGGVAWAYVETAEGAYQRRKLELGRWGDAFFEVKSGVTEGEKIVTSGSLLIDSQAAIEGEPDAGETIESVSATILLEAADLSSIRAIADSCSRISSALAGDDLKGFNTGLMELKAVLSKLRASARNEAMASQLDRIIPELPSESCANIKLARAVQVKLGEWSARLIQAAGKSGIRGVGFHVYHCPMAPTPGLWISQADSVMNPFFGKSMLKCGEEVLAEEHNNLQVPASSIPSPVPTESPGIRPVEKSENKAPQTDTAPAKKTEGMARNRSNLRTANTHADAELMLMTAKDEFKSQLRARAIAGNGARQPKAAPLLTESQCQLLRSFFEESEHLGLLLADGKWQEFNRSAAKMNGYLEPFLQNLGAPPRWGPVVESIRVLAAFGPSDSLEDARRRYAPFIESAASLLQEVADQQTAFAALRITNGKGGLGTLRWIESKEHPFNPFGPQGAAGSTNAP